MLSFGDSACLKEEIVNLKSKAEFTNSLIAASEDNYHLN